MNRPSKPAKVDSSVQKLSSGEEIRALLRSQDVDILTRGLTSIRNQFTVKPDENISPQDSRLILAQQWLNGSPGAEDIFTLWAGAEQRQTASISLLLSVLAVTLSLVSSHYTYHSLGHPIVKQLLSPQWTRKLNSYISGSSNDLILSTLKLYNSLSGFARGRERKGVLEAFAWETKSLPKLMNLRRKSKTDESLDPLAKPDIRTLYILFLLSFVDTNTPVPVKVVFLEQHRDAFVSMFKGLSQDHYPVIRKVLEVSWAGIWSEPKLKRTLKIGVFNETTIAQLAKVYDRVDSEDEDPEHVPANIVHHFLLAICTRPGTGICFKDNGWYPRDVEDAQDDEEVPKSRGGKLYNKMLANVLRSLKVNEDMRQQELSLKIMSSCPELVAGYWSAASLTLEPRLSSRWITNIALFGSIISLPIPVSCFILSENTDGVLYQPSPPPLSIVLENVFPLVNTKVHFTKGLQQASRSLVQHCTALALSKCLMKYRDVTKHFRMIADALEEGEADGQWSKRCRDLEKEARKRVPEFQVIVGYSQRTTGQLASQLTESQRQTQAALLAESAQRLLWLYHDCLPDSVSEARFDIGKMLINFSSTETVEGEGNNENMSPAARKLHLVRQLHVLRLLQSSDQFSWASKPGQTFINSDPFHFFTKALTSSNVLAIHSTLVHLLEHLLGNSIMFQHNPDEVHLWLISLPMGRRPPSGGESPDGAKLTDEPESVLTFLDDCIQRCAKTPYRYIEEIQALESIEDRAESQLPSPLLITLSEQLSAKLTAKLLSASDVLALATFIRSLVFQLQNSFSQGRALLSFTDKIDGILEPQKLFPEYPIVTTAIRREVEILKYCLGHLRIPKPPTPTSIGKDVKSFLRAVEGLPIPPIESARIVAAYELVDWLRLLEQQLRPVDMERLVTIVHRFFPPALEALSQAANPAHRLLWNGVKLVSNELLPYAKFDWLFVSADEEQIQEQDGREILVNAVFAHLPSLSDLKRVMCQISHCITVAAERASLLRGLLQLLNSLITRSASVLPKADCAELKGFVFALESVQKLCTSSALSEPVREALSALVKDTLDTSSPTEKGFASDIAFHWLNEVRVGLGSNASISLPFSIDMGGLAKDREQAPILDLLDTVISAVRDFAMRDAQAEYLLRARTIQLINLRSHLSNSAVLEELLAIALRSSFAITPRWSHRLEPLPTELQFVTLLQQEYWTSATAEILRSLIYKRPCPYGAFSSWLGTNQCLERDPLELVSVLYSYLDVAKCRGIAISEAEAESWVRHGRRMFKWSTDESSSPSLRHTASACVTLLFQLLPFHRSQLEDLILNDLSKLSVKSLTPGMLLVGLNIGGKASALTSALAEHGVQWAVRHFTDENPIDDMSSRCVKYLTDVVKTVSLKSHIVEPLLTAVTQFQLWNTAAVELLTAVLSHVPFKPLIVNRVLQNVIQHHRFAKICSVTGASSSPLRDAIVNLLHVLFHLHPSNTCQITHIVPLMAVYHGTASISDRKLLSIFRLFEAQRKTSIGILFNQWNASHETMSNGALEAIQSLDPTLLLQTCLHYPNWRRVDDQVDQVKHPVPTYDPLFVILLFAHTLAEDPPQGTFPWIEFFRTNVVGLVIRSLSAKGGHIRELAIYCISALWKQLETVEMQEKPSVLYILGLLRDTIPQPSAGECPKRLPTYSTLILLHALRGVFYPSHFAYPLTARFLLQRPELDISDVPMLFGLLYSSSDNWKQERAWMIRLLSDGLVGTDDWRVFKRRHTWDLLASIFQASNDVALRKGILEVLANLTCIPQATTSLVLKSGLHCWIEMQLLNLVEDESIAWLKIIENIICCSDAKKLETATSGQWRWIIGRCMSLLLNDSSSVKLSVLSLVARVLLRLALLPGPLIPSSTSLLNRTVYCLEETEKQIEWKPLGMSRSAPTPLSSLHTKLHLFDNVSDDPVREWGQAVESLWRVSMTFSDKEPAWDLLSSRLLIWRAQLDAVNNTGVAEWARAEVIRSLT
ncbi:ribosome 60S biogenesis N-terminal-domain-containing protein [Desarmillaria tabescens]|uniref:Ribosome 60S biogenesis N-terminal-domain-containing protein n=1 Tax=Armillaria tabescens TaxID=1929756 RepID=A0AA39K730_ARMTA|nr:ribosome 60S biogenesis N-terminal-domain-containing protein [Desarmillaria tabescens]KAK0455710.1 ribosome 60S biogenesis N-terminal-domain-containing protein [Desarmillaria tabescens]